MAEYLIIQEMDGRTVFVEKGNFEKWQEKLGEKLEKRSYNFINIEVSSTRFFEVEQRIRKYGSRENTWIVDDNYIYRGLIRFTLDEKARSLLEKILKEAKE